MAYRYCLAMSAEFTQPRAHFLAEPCSWVRCLTEGAVVWPGIDRQVADSALFDLSRQTRLMLMRALLCAIAFLHLTLVRIASLKLPATQVTRGRRSSGEFFWLVTLVIKFQPSVSFPKCKHNCRIPAVQIILTATKLPKRKNPSCKKHALF